ncbi:unnamed protein product [Rhizoctonia solani]|uniref:Glucose receptor Git3 N-terminal domain-containing protein n=1 Tax=Rhizoctonia solani TaxID=456999 RepID=A0A8H3BCY9_9AGAM|nr:unnamed protein product [Rhizoctonia solani]
MSCIPSSELFDVPTGFNYCASPVCLSTGDVIGLSFTAQMGFISALSIMILLGFMTIRYLKNARGLIEPSGAFIRTNIDALMLNLLVADLLVAFGAIINVHWASKSQVSCGQVCNTQGAIQVEGETSVALFTLAITVLTFISIVRGCPVKCHFHVWGSITAGVWFFSALWAGIGGTLDRFYAPTPYWCWISSEFKAQRVGAEYAWLWISGFGSILLYTPLFFILRGNIKWDPMIGWRSLGWSWKKEDTAGGNRLLWYLPITLSKPTYSLNLSINDSSVDFVQRRSC